MGHERPATFDILPGLFSIWGEAAYGSGRQYAVCLIRERVDHMMPFATLSRLSFEWIGLAWAGRRLIARMYASSEKIPCSSSPRFGHDSAALTLKRLFTYFDILLRRGEPCGWTANIRLTKGKVSLGPACGLASCFSYSSIQCRGSE